MAKHSIRNMYNAFTAPSDSHGEIVVIGLGRFGSALASTLIEMGHEVLAIDVGAERVQAHSELLTQVVQADSTNRTTLEELGVGDATSVFVCIGAALEASVLTTSVLSEMKVPNIWAKALTEDHGRILAKVGADHVVYPEADSGRRLARLMTGSLMEYLALDEDFVLIEMKAPHHLTGVPLGDTNIRADYKVTIVCIKPHQGSFTYAESATVIGDKALIVVAGHRADIERFANVETHPTDDD